MGGRTAPEIAARLLAEGLPAGTPVVALASVSRADEQRWQGSLRDLLAAPPFRDSAAPVLIGVGRSFAAVTMVADVASERDARTDRKSGREGKSVEVRVGLGGRRIIQKKNTTRKH